MTDVQESAVMVNHADAVAPDTSLPSLPPPPPSSPSGPVDTVPLSAAPSNCPSPDTTLHEIAEVLPAVAENNPFAQSWTCAGRMEELDKRCNSLETMAELNRSSNAFVQQKIDSLQSTIETCISLEKAIATEMTRNYEALKTLDTCKSMIKANEKKSSWALGLAIVGALFGAVSLVRSFCK